MNKRITLVLVLSIFIFQGCVFLSSPDVILVDDRVYVSTDSYGRSVISGTLENIGERSAYSVDAQFTLYNYGVIEDIVSTFHYQIPTGGTRDFDIVIYSGVDWDRFSCDITCTDGKGNIYNTY